LGYEIAANGVSPLFGEALVELISAYAVGVAFDLKLQARVSQDDSGNLGQLHLSPGLQRVFAGVEQDIRHVDDQAASRFAGIEDVVELLAKLLA
jgi:hypothetical protein